MKNPKELIGKKVIGFKFEENKDLRYKSPMEKYIGKIGKIGEVAKIYKDGTCVIDFGDDFFFYPADQIEAHLVEDEETIKEEIKQELLKKKVLISTSDIEIQNEIPTFTKEDLKSFYNIGFVNGVNSDNKSSCLEFEKEFNKRFNPTKEEQLTAILGSSDKVVEIMELFKN